MAVFHQTLLGEEASCATRGVLIKVGRLFTFRVGLKGLLRTSLYANACYLVADVALNAYVDGSKSELEKFQQMLSVEGGAEDMFVKIE